MAALFEELAELLELGGESPFKTRAYRAFATTLTELGEPVLAIAARGELTGMPGVGKAISKKVVDIGATGTCAALERARAAVPASLRTLLVIPGLGVKGVRTLWSEAQITTVEGLATACEDNALAALDGFGPKKQARILAAVRELLRRNAGVLLAAALDAAAIVEAALRVGGAAEVALVGEARRGIELVHGVDLIARGIDAKRAAVAISGIEALGAPTATATDGAASLVVHGELHVTVTLVRDDAWLLELLTRTGDDAHVAWLRSEAEGDLAPICARAKDERTVYAALGLPLIPPELRAGAVSSVPPHLVARDDVRGVFHVHTDWSDGSASIVEMARAASDTGLRFLGISDHSKAASYANGLDGARLAEQRASVAIARREISDCTIFHGIEVDILADGALDLDDALLAELDFVIASVHSRMGMSHEEMTARIVRAVSHPLVTILGHPTGRLLLGRKGYTFDVAAVARAAAANDTYLEINANAQRLDLDSTLVREAAREGARFAIDPDAHGVRGLADTALGVTVARRAGLSREQVLNARDRDEMGAVLAARKARAMERLGGA
jgi:DNA polymerase (family 10)